MITQQTIFQKSKTPAVPAGNNPKILPASIICFSHLRWDFVYQRPQHLLSRFAETFKVYFIEEPIFDATIPHYSFHKKSNNLTVLVPHLPKHLNGDNAVHAQKKLLNEWLIVNAINEYMCWYYTPMALNFSRQLDPAVTIFDCMDELSAFRFAPQELKALEAELLARADVVFTGGSSLYNAKKGSHPNLHLFPSSIDKKHFAKARKLTATPGDQSRIAAPRLGFFGVIDERFDTALVDKIAALRPNWHLIILGPLAKISMSDLPDRPNIHYLGNKSYMELPDYLAGWDVATIPFAINESTRYISPTKTPEYLAAGIPVISTPITDVIEPYGRNGLVYIAATAEEFVMHAETIMNDKIADTEWLQKVDDFLAHNSWDITVDAMHAAIKNTVQNNVHVS